MKIIEHTQCRICDGHLASVLDLGEIHTSDFTADGHEGLRAPLNLCACSQCGLVQLKHTVDPELLYRKYWYRSASNAAMIAALADVVRGIEERAELRAGDLVLDIGCNDGTLLSLYAKKHQLIRIGFDPANNLEPLAAPHCDSFENDFFTGDKFRAFGYRKNCKVVTSIAMFYDLEDINGFTADVRSILAHDGLWVIQFTDLVSMLRANAFDNICHEHLEYYSFQVLQKLMVKHGLEIFDVEENFVNGGSIRIYVAHKGARTIEEDVSARLGMEMAYLRGFADPFTAFAERVQAARQATMEFIQQEREAGKSIFALGASTKGNTLLQYFGITEQVIPYAAEVNADKFGLKTQGSGLKIIPQDDAMDMSPDYFLVLPWHFMPNFIEKNLGYLLAGGKFIAPLPEPCVYSSDAEGNIKTEFLNFLTQRRRD